MFQYYLERVSMSAIEKKITCDGNNYFCLNPICTEAFNLSLFISSRFFSHN